VNPARRQAVRPKSPGGGVPTGTRWIHAFEEDTARGSVYRPETEDLPLSRRPRDQLELAANGSARLFIPGPDDRLREHAASWHVEGSEIVILVASTEHPAPRKLRVVEQSPDRIVVRT